MKFLEATLIGSWTQPGIKYRTGWLALYAHLAESAYKGAVLRFPDGI